MPERKDVHPEQWRLPPQFRSHHPADEPDADAEAAIHGNPPDTGDLSAASRGVSPAEQRQIRPGQSRKPAQDDRGN
jgi:hypothetical protein